MTTLTLQQMNRWTLARQMLLERSRLVLTLTPLETITAPHRAELEEEGTRLLAWLRPDTDRRDLRWMMD